jgi:hypothetical protein
MRTLRWGDGRPSPQPYFSGCSWGEFSVGLFLRIIAVAVVLAGFAV